MNFQFKKECPFEKRRSEAEEIRRKFHGKKVLVIVEKVPDTRIENLEKRKLLVSVDLLLEKLYSFIRMELNLKPEAPMFLIINNVVQSLSETISSLYDKNHEEDFCLYISYSHKNVYN